jgi:GntR family negative regulator for fad regulon and positive regulator of fabA
MTTDQFVQEGEPPWEPIQKPAEIAETRLIRAILEGAYPINSHLPGERELAEILGVTRSTLREVLQRLARDGWLNIQHGKPTRVCDYWKEGRLGVLNTLSEQPDQLPNNFIPDLLTARLAMAPMYTSMAVANAPEKVMELLAGRKNLEPSPEDFSNFDWLVQHELTILGQNAVFVLILNGFKDLYLNLAPIYFSIPAARQHSMDYYEALSKAAIRNDIEQSRKLTEDVMRESLIFWYQTNIL